MTKKKLYSEYDRWFFVGFCSSSKSLISQEWRAKKNKTSRYTQKCWLICSIRSKYHSFEFLSSLYENRISFVHHTHVIKHSNDGYDIVFLIWIVFTLPAHLIYVYFMIIFLFLCFFFEFHGIYQNQWKINFLFLDVSIKLEFTARDKC